MMPFNSEEVARTLYNMDTYVISAVGHETDFTLADFAADARALTPTAAAEMIAFDTKQLTDDIINELSLAGRKLLGRFNMLGTKVTELTGRVTIGVTKELAKMSERVNGALITAKYAVERTFNTADHRIDALTGRLCALNPARILRSGYFKAEKDAHNVNSVGELKTGDVIKLFGYDGYAEASIINTTINNDNNTEKK